MMTLSFPIHGPVNTAWAKHCYDTLAELGYSLTHGRVSKGYIIYTAVRTAGR